MTFEDHNIFIGFFIESFCIFLWGKYLAVADAIIIFTDSLWTNYNIDDHNTVIGFFIESRVV